MRLRIDRSTTLLGIVTLSAILTVVPTGTATAQDYMVSPVPPPGADPSRRSVLRPILAKLPTRTYYLSGYAGATYPPLGQGVRNDPTLTRTARRPIFSGWFRKH